MSCIRDSASPSRAEHKQRGFVETVARQVLETCTSDGSNAGQCFASVMAPGAERGFRAGSDTSRICGWASGYAFCALLLPFPSRHRSHLHVLRSHQPVGHQPRPVQRPSCLAETFYGSHLASSFVPLTQPIGRLATPHIPRTLTKQAESAGCRPCVRESGGQGAVGLEKVVAICPGIPVARGWGLSVFTILAHDVVSIPSKRFKRPFAKDFVETDAKFFFPRKFLV